VAFASAFLRALSLRLGLIELALQVLYLLFVQLDRAISLRHHVLLPPEIAQRRLARLVILRTGHE
jgi:hypothetical protein